MSGYILRVVPSLLLNDREALMSGNDNSAITEQGFVTVCRKYGLVQLVREHITACHIVVNL